MVGLVRLHRRRWAKRVSSEYDYHSIRTCIDCFGCTADAGLYFYRETFDDYWISGDRNSDYSFLFVFDI